MDAAEDVGDADDAAAAGCAAASADARLYASVRIESFAGARKAWATVVPRREVGVLRDEDRARGGGTGDPDAWCCARALLTDSRTSASEVAAFTVPAPCGG